MIFTSKTVERAIQELSKLPGIGRKSAQRTVFHLLNAPAEDVEHLAQSLLELKENVHTCSICFNITEEDPCAICQSDRRDAGVICVVEEASDILAFERSGEFKGRYHVLGGVLSPLDGVGPDDLNIKALLTRLDDSVREVIVATNPSTEGEATALYLSKLIKPLNIKLSRIARGIPVGADLEYADDVTLMRALEGRVSL
jgi:recombination protein RecR